MASDQNGDHIMTIGEKIEMCCWGLFGGLAALYGLVFFG
jgi:hypothetical protein